MCADPTVMTYFPRTLTKAESSALIDRSRAMIEKNGFGTCAIEHIESSEFLGMVGLNWIESGLEFAPCVEVLWRLSSSFWGQGYATEAANKSLEIGFAQLGLSEIIAYTAKINTPSIRVMQKLGMAPASDTFMHPNLANDHPLCEHVLYSIDSFKFQREARS